MLRLTRPSEFSIPLLFSSYYGTLWHLHGTFFQNRGQTETRRSAGNFCCCRLIYGTYCTCTFQIPPYARLTTDMQHSSTRFSELRQRRYKIWFYLNREILKPKTYKAVKTNRQSSSHSCTVCIITNINLRKMRQSVVLAKW